MKDLHFLKTGRHLSECKSTNQVIANMLDSNDSALNAKGFYITAQYQTGGKGYGNNLWHSTKGENLLLSMLITETGIPPELQFNVSRWIALAIKDALLLFFPEENNISVKWPNDILWNHKKICGILIEHRIAGARLSHSIIGIGLNLNQHSFPKHLNMATSVFLQTGVSLTQDRVISQLALSMNEVLHKSNFDLECLHELYDSELYLKGQTHKFIDTNGAFYGTIMGTEANGLLKVNSSTGTRHYGFKEVKFTPVKT